MSENRVTMIRPSLHRLSTDKMPDWMTRWAWVRLSELAHVWLNLSRLDRVEKVDNNAPVEVWKRYFPLTTGTSMYISGGNRVCEVEFCGASLSTTFRPSSPNKEKYAFGSAKEFIQQLILGALFVPAGWSERVLNAVEHGTFHVPPKGPGLDRPWFDTLLERYQDLGVNWKEMNPCAAYTPPSEPDPFESIFSQFKEDDSWDKQEAESEETDVAPTITCTQCEFRTSIAHPYCSCCGQPVGS